MYIWYTYIVYKFLHHILLWDTEERVGERDRRALIRFQTSIPLYNIWYSP